MQKSGVGNDRSFGFLIQTFLYAKAVVHGLAMAEPHFWPSMLSAIPLLLCVCVCGGGGGGGGGSVVFSFALLSFYCTFKGTKIYYP